jgi:hypothetical protein
VAHWTHFIPRLRTYEEALKHYTNVAPVRGDAEKRRPLGRRRDKGLHIVQEKNGDISIVNWRYKHITYRQSGGIELRHITMCDIGLAQLISCLLDVECFIRHFTVWIACEAQVGEETKEGFLPLSGHSRHEVHKATTVDTFSFVNGRLRAHNPNFPVQHVLDKKKFNEAKKKYKSFYRYLVANAKLRGVDGYSEEERGKTSLVDTYYVPIAGEGWRQEAVVIEAAASDDTAKHYALFLAMIPNEVVIQYYWYKPTAARNIKLMKKQFTEFVLHNHHKEVVSKQTVYSMKVTKDEYQWVANLPT